MDMAYALIFAIIGYTGVVNVIATVEILRHMRWGVSQPIIFMLLTWCVPIIGAHFCLKKLKHMRLSREAIATFGPSRRTGTDGGFGGDSYYWGGRSATGTSMSGQPVDCAAFGGVSSGGEGGYGAGDFGGGGDCGGGGDGGGGD